MMMETPFGFHERAHGFLPPESVPPLKMPCHDEAGHWSHMPHDGYFEPMIEGILREDGARERRP